MEEEAVYIIEIDLKEKKERNENQKGGKQRCGRIDSCQGD